MWLRLQYIVFAFILTLYYLRIICFFFVYCSITVTVVVIFLVVNKDLKNVTLRFLELMHTLSRTLLPVDRLNSVCVKLHLRHKRTKTHVRCHFVRCVCQGRPSYGGNGTRCFI